MFRTVCEYAHISIIEAKDLSCDEFMLYFRCAVIDSLMKSEQGVEVLQDWQRDLVDDDENGIESLTILLGEGVENG